MKYSHAISARKAAKASVSVVPACVLIWVAREFFHLDVPAEVGAALAGMLGGAVAYIRNIMKHGERA